MTDEQVSGIRCYRFGRFVIDAHRMHLWRDDESVQLPLKAIEVLAVLVERSGTVVTKDELLAHVWPQTVVEENNLARQISNLRKALHDSREQHEFIVTFPGRGYRFAMPVEEVRHRPVATRGGLPNQSSSEGGGFGTNASAPLAASAAEAVSRPVQTGRWRGRAGDLLGASAAVLLVTLPLIWWADSAETRGRRTDGELVRLTFGSSLQHQPSWSPDGSGVVFASDADGNSDIWIQRLGQPLPARLTTSPEHESQPAWSPDGRWIVFRSERAGGGLDLVPAEGGPPRRIASFGFRPRWSPSGQLILFSSSVLDSTKALPYVVPIDGGPPRLVRPDVLGGFASAHLAWRPREDRVSLWGRQRTGQWAFLTMSLSEAVPPVVSDLSDAAVNALGDSDLRLGAFVWAPSSDRLYFEGRSGDTANLWSVEVERSELSWVAAPERLTLGPGVDRDFALSPDGRRVAFSSVSERTRLWAFGLSAAGTVGDGVPLTSGNSGEYDAAAPRDGLRLAFRTVRGGRQQLWERSMGDGVERVLLAGNEWSGTSPRWAHDGRTLAYGRRGLGPSGIRLVDAETGAERLLTLPPDVTMELVPDDWSADGSQILAACRPASGQPHRTCIVTLDGSSRIADVRVVASAPGLSLICQRFSPDERWISFMAVDRNRPGTSTLYVMPAAGGPWVAVTEGVSYDDKPRWSGDGRTIYFISDRGGPVNLWGRRFDPASGMPVGEPFQASAFDSPARMVPSELQRAEIAVSADRVFLPLTDTAGDVWVLDLPDR